MSGNNPFSSDQCDSATAQGQAAVDRLKRKTPANSLLTENALKGNQERSAGHRASPHNQDGNKLQSTNLLGSCRPAWSFERNNQGCIIRPHNTGPLQVFLVRDPGARCWVTGCRMLANYMTSMVKKLWSRNKDGSLQKEKRKVLGGLMSQEVCI